jgi:hypothetical protein
VSNSFKKERSEREERKKREKKETSDIYRTHLDSTTEQTH